MAEGWVKTHRTLSEHPMWLAEKFTRGQAWMDLIMLANHWPGHIRIQGVKIDVQRGDVGWSEVALSARWKWSRGKVRRFMAQLADEQMLTQKRYTGQDKRNRLSTIVNYEKFQGENYSDDTSGDTRDGHATDMRRYTNKNEKNEKKKRKALVSEDRDSSSGAPHADSARAQKRPNCPQAEIIALYHECLPQLPPVVSLGATAKATLRARWNEDPKHKSLDFWRSLFATVAASDFLMGRVKEWRCPGLLWIIGPKNFAKIVNGQYVNHGTRTGSALTDANARAGQAWLEDSQGVAQ